MMDLAALAPLATLAGAAIVVVLAISFARGHRLAFALTLAGLAASAAWLPAVWRDAPWSSTLLVVDRYALFYIGLLLATSFAVALLAFPYLARGEEPAEEFYVLLLIATLGAAVLVTSRHFAAFFLALETLSVSLFGLLAYFRTTRRGVEAALKYLILAGASSAILLFGAALVYAETGSLELAAMTRAASGARALVPAGLTLVLCGIGFKLAVVPFHMWTPDVYVGAPAPVTAFVATVSKGGVFALLLRAFAAEERLDATPIFAVLAAIAIASMLAGNLLALLQRNVKRILAYSSIAHLGYLLVAFLAGGSAGREAATYYLVAYSATTAAAFGVVTALSSPGREAEDLADYRGLYWRRPALAAVFTASLLSLAGIPLTAGFLAKYFVLAAGVGEALWALVLVLVAGSAVGLVYYLRIIVAMLAPASEGATMPATPRTAAFVLAVLFAAIVWFGVWPAPLQRWIAEAMAGLS